MMETKILKKTRELAFLCTIGISGCTLANSQIPCNLNYNNNLKKLLEAPIRNFDSLKVANIKTITSGVFNNRNRLILKKGKNVYVGYSIGENVGVIVVKNNYGYLDDKNELVVSIIVGTKKFKTSILNVNLNIGDSKKDLISSLGNAAIINDSVLVSIVR